MSNTSIIHYIFICDYFSGWKGFVAFKIKLWKEFYMDWLKLCPPEKVHITYYETMKDDPVKEMQVRYILARYIRIPPVLLFFMFFIRIYCQCLPLADG